MKMLYEQIIAYEVARIVPDLRQIDLPCYMRHLHQGHYGNVADLVEAACERHFHPLTLRFGYKGEGRLTWETLPIICLLMEFYNSGLFASFHLTLEATSCSFALKYLSFGSLRAHQPTPTAKADILRHALRDAQLKQAIENPPPDQTSRSN